MSVARSVLGARMLQYVAAATHIRCTASDSMASNGKHHHAVLKTRRARRRPGAPHESVSVPLEGGAAFWFPLHFTHSMNE